MFQSKLLVLGAFVAFAAMAAPAHAQTPVGASVSSTQALGLRYLGGDAANDVRLTLSGSTFTVDDIVPIQAGDGCTPVAGDATKVRCVAIKAGSKFKELFVVAGNGNDKVVNATSTATVAGAPMAANGGSGNDTLIGDLKNVDRLFGSNGNDELRAIGGLDELDGGAGDDKLLGGVSGDKLVGGLGNDLLDGGGSDDILEGGSGRDILDGGPAGISPGERRDRVIYSDHSGAVKIDLSRTDASQGIQANPSLGIPAEGDTILDVEDIVSGSGNDVLFGNQFDNTIDGGAGGDIVAGQQGRDILVGGDGNDLITPSPAPNIQFPIGAVPDGEPDLVECGKFGRSDGDAGDQAFRVVVDGDVANDCATVVDQ